MINKNFMVALAIPFFLTGCIIAVDADDTNHKSLTILHQVGDDELAQSHADKQCARNGDVAELVEADMSAEDNIVRATFVCD